MKSWPDLATTAWASGSVNILHSQLEPSPWPGVGCLRSLAQERHSSLRLHCGGEKLVQKVVQKNLSIYLSLSVFRHLKPSRLFLNFPGNIFASSIQLWKVKGPDHYKRIYIVCIVHTLCKVCTSWTLWIDFEVDMGAL